MIEFIKECLPLVYKDHKRKRRIRIGLYRCSCGKEFETRIIKKLPKTCGCIFKKGVHTTHGKSKNTKVYTTWIGMKDRCYNPKNRDYLIYGGRGIKMQEDWVYDFEKFYKYIGEKPDGKFSIERIDVNGNYEEGNIKWANDIEQANNRRNNRKLEFMGKNLTIADWERETGIPQARIYNRIFINGWSVEKALTCPKKINQFI